MRRTQEQVEREKLVKIGTVHSVKYVLDMVIPVGTAPPKAEETKEATSEGIKEAMLSNED